MCLLGRAARALVMWVARPWWCWWFFCGGGCVVMRVCVGVRGVGLLVGLLVLCVGVLGWGVQAWGGVGFVFSSGFAPPAPGGFLAPVGVGVDNSSGGSRGDVYVADQGSDVLYKFAGSGGLLGEVDVSGGGGG